MIAFELFAKCIDLTGIKRFLECKVKPMVCRMKNVAAERISVEKCADAEGRREFS